SSRRLREPAEKVCDAVEYVVRGERSASSTALLRRSARRKPVTREVRAMTTPRNDGRSRAEPPVNQTRTLTGDSETRARKGRERVLGQADRHAGRVPRERFPAAFGDFPRVQRGGALTGRAGSSS